MPSDDILDLIGRYATGSLSDEEHKRLFDAALDDQDLFEQLVREQDMKQLLDQPGARDRMIRALEPPKRKTAWIFGVAATAALSAAMVAVLLRPVPKPPAQVAVVKIPARTEVAQPEHAPQPVATPPPPVSKQQPVPPPAAAPAPATEPAPIREETRRADAATPKPVTPVSQVSTEEPLRDGLKKEKDQAPPAAPPPPPQLARQSSSRFQAIQPLVSQQQNAPGGPRQNNAEQARKGVVGGYVNGAAGKAQDVKTGAVGFHYSLEIQGHLSIIPAVDGYLYVKSNDGAVLFGPKLSAAGIVVDLPLSSAVSSIVITFAENADPVQTNPVVHTEPTGTVQGAAGLAIQLKLKP